MDLRKELDTLIGNDYGELKPAIIEIFLLYQKKYEYSDEEILEECNNLKNYLDLIEFGNMNDEGLKGYSSSGTKAIRLSQDFLDMDYTKDENYTMLAEILTHELFHSKNYYESVHQVNKKQSRGIFGRRDKKEQSKITTETGIEENWGTAANEVWDENAATDTIFGSRDPNHMSVLSSPTYWYNNITFLSSILAGALGMTDTEIIKPGVKREDLFNKKIYEKFNDESSKQEATALLLKIKDNIDVIHKCNYMSKKRTKNQTKIQTKMVASSISEIFNDSCNLAMLQIETDERPISTQLALELQIRYHKIIKSKEHALDQFYTEDPNEKRTKILFDESDIRSINDKCDANIQKLHQCVVGVTIVSKYKDKMTIEDFNKFSDLAKQGLLKEQQDYLMETYGIDYEKEESDKKLHRFRRIHYASQYGRRILKEDANYGKENDLTELRNALKIAVNKQKAHDLETIPKLDRINKETAKMFSTWKTFSSRESSVLYAQIKMSRNSFEMSAKGIFKKEDSMYTVNNTMFYIYRNAISQLLKPILHQKINNRNIIKLAKCYDKLNTEYDKYLGIVAKEGLVDKEALNNELMATKNWYATYINAAYMINQMPISQNEKLEMKNDIYLQPSAEGIIEAVKKYGIELDENNIELLDGVKNKINKKKNKDSIKSLPKSKTKYLPEGSKNMVTLKDKRKEFMGRINVDPQSQYSASNRINGAKIIERKEEEQEEEK